MCPIRTHRWLLYAPSTVLRRKKRRDGADGWLRKKMEKIKEIYETLMQATGETKAYRKQIENQIRKMLKERKETMEENDYETLWDQFYLAAMAAEKGGFILGFRYAAQLMAECYAGATAGSE